ncbi:hypothetical protein [Sporosarcina jiandibaonis]|uniref:hypothetical protein n=1 Tax=Sporosarcina jiandibaonis TaxID=2715535 RepID=UPI0015575FE8|nr:hypothetical protein [Sporosarcina jiandibaonis]
MEIRNEKGYTLLVVLLVVTFIMIIAASFATASVSTAKQEKTVDENNLAVVAAEMGVDHYKTAMLNEFINRREELIIAAQHEINELVANPDFAGLNETQKEDELQDISLEIGEMLKSFLDAKIQTLLGGERVTPIDGDTKYELVDLSVKIEDVVEEVEVEVTKQVVVNGKISGVSTNTNKDKRELEFDLKFNFINLSNVNLDIDGGQEIDFENPSEGAKVCDQYNGGEKCKLINIESSTVYFKDGYINPKSNTNAKDFKNSNIYVNGNIDVQNLNGLSNVYINVSGDFLAQNLQSDLGIDNSTIVVGGSLQGKNMLVTNTTILVNSDFKAGQLKVVDNSKVCIGGDLKGEPADNKETSIDLTIEKLSEVYLREKGNHKYIIKNQIENNPIMLSNVEFIKLCSLGTITFPPVEDKWGEPIIDVKY